MRAVIRGGAQALLVNGTVGVGKTSVAEAVGDLLADAGVSHAVLDLDWLRKSWPAPPGDRFNFGLLLRNVRSIAGNYLDAGATRLVLAGVVERQDERKQLADAVGADLTVCWLQAELPVIHQRLAQRHANEPAALRWHLDRSAELDAILSRAAVDDFTVDTTTSSVHDAAASVIRAANWQ
ncbi:MULTISPECIES: AAA family ATPase [unclassified Streptomyces]|uniref:AAA family ATPase n=1 Tax=unclassified Streptomyces TaxID=2593676 RepID=UPI002E80E491|nr:AAA family ATPase [Streptomyces sp. NBC_00523]WUC99833.1 AAA family ATPase [Streptomyces sp. NBC_00523]